MTDVGTNSNLPSVHPVCPVTTLSSLVVDNTPWNRESRLGANVVD